MNIDDDVYAAARQYAELKRIAIGTAISELLRRGLDRPPASGVEYGLPVFSVSESAPRFGLAQVKTDEDEA